MASYVQIPPDSTGKKIYQVSHSIAPDTVYAQVVHLADPVSASYLQAINEYGAASITFAEGQPTLDTFNNLRVGEGSIIAGYEYTNGPMNDLFTDTKLIGGDIVYNATASLMVLSTNATSGSYSQRTTNRYHYYQPGVAHLIVMSAGMGDTGKEGNVREWGYYDDNDGIFFQLSGSILNVVKRNKSSGTIIDDVIPQSSWNRDKLDGTGTSNFAINVSKYNLYFIDFAWLGAGVVRFGVIGSKGNRILCHEFENPNNITLPWSSKPALPLRTKNINYTGTSGTSELKMGCFAVYADSRVDYTFWRFGDLEALHTPISGSNIPLLSARAKLVYEGNITRANAYPERMAMFIEGGATKIDMVWGGTLSGSTWAISSSGMLEADTSATSYTLTPNGYVMNSWYFDPGSHNVNLSSLFETNDEGILLLADGVTQPTITFAATPLTATPSSASICLSYKELR